MRAGACTVQQTLTSEAASVLKHSLSLARRRGHAQVTPLHVAATLLSSRASLLRRACIKSQPHPTSHPLQCRALELCFNVALNRLPTTPGPLFHSQPSLSNALIAALKRAQAHQRRGCIEQQQQQPLLAIKVELEQLIISILDDPSVSRVMREAGFSSTCVKNNLEDSSATSVFPCYSSSGGVFSSPCSPSPSENRREVINHSSYWQTHLLNCSFEKNPVLFPTQKKHLGTLVTDSATVKEDIRLVLEVLLRKKRRNTVIVGDSLSTTEGMVSELMGKVERGEVPEELRPAHFIKFQFPSVSLRFMKKEDVEMKIADLRRKVGSLASGGGAIIYAGDLKWTVEAAPNERGRFSIGDASGYSTVDHFVTEIGTLLSDYSYSNSKVWLIATSNYQTYMRCQMKQPPLETQWALQAVSVPSGGLGLSLFTSSILDSKMTLSQNTSHMMEANPFTSKEEQDQLTCCAECTSNYEKEAGMFESGQHKLSTLLLSSCNTKDVDKGTTSLPYWLQPHGADNQQKDDLVELRGKWNRLCHNLHHSRPNHTHLSSSLCKTHSLSAKSFNYTPAYPWWPTGSEYNQNNGFRDSNSISFNDSSLKLNNTTNFMAQFGRHQSCTIEFGLSNGTNKQHSEELSLDTPKNTENKEARITLALGNSVFSDSVTLLDKKRKRTMDPQALCKVLQKNVPWQSDTIPSIAEALVNSQSTNKKGTWLLIQGTDWIGKRRLALAIAESLFGSSNHIIHMNMRRIETEAIPFSKILTESMRNHEKNVVLLEDFDYADGKFSNFLADCFDLKNFGDPIGRESSPSQAIFIITKGGSSSYKTSNAHQTPVLHMKLQVEKTTPNSGTPTINHKRKAKWDSPNMTPSKKREFSRQSSSNTLDLNIQAEEEEDDNEGEDKQDESNHFSSDLTQETAAGLRTPDGFLESIENRFVFDRNPAQFSQMTESFLAKIKGCFEEVFESEKLACFYIDEVVLEEILVGSGSFLNGLFEKWLKDVFQTSLESVFKKGGKEVTVRLCFGDQGESVLKAGFMGSNLPKTIQVAFKD